MIEDRAFVVVPFQRMGSYIGPQQMLIFNSVEQARLLANDLSRKFPGVALIEKRVDEDTGADIQTVIATSGAVPDSITQSANWTMPLH